MKYLILSFSFLLLFISSLFGSVYGAFSETERLCYKARHGNLYIFDKSILKYYCGRINIAHLLAEHNPSWTPNDSDTLKLRSDNTSIAGILAQYNPNWRFINDSKILKKEYMQ